MNTAIVTGSTKGIGKAASMLLAKNRFNVVVCSRTVYYADSVVCETNLTEFYTCSDSERVGLILISASEIDSFMEQYLYNFLNHY